MLICLDGRTWLKPALFLKMFIDKLTKAQQETQKTTDRLKKLEAKWNQMKANEPDPAPQDAYLVLRDLVLEKMTRKDIDLSKCYIRALVDDDSFCTHFGQLSPTQLQWPDSIYLPLKRRNLAETCVYVMVCINTESEISYCDNMLANVSLLGFNVLCRVSLN